MILSLTKILNSCLRHCYFPISWKKAITITLPKPGKNINEPGNYRPIALLSSISKVYEKIILEELRRHLTDKIRPEQSGFRANHSTTQQLVSLVDKLSNKLNNREHIATLFLDVEKAFDRVWHEGLIYKMQQMDIPLHLIKLIESFLTGRTFSVRSDDMLSSPRKVLAGVPQGSCLAPTLYLIYTNDIPVNLKAEVSLFADDTMFCTHDRNPNRAVIQLQKQTELASKWFEKWRLRINTFKSVAVLFGRKKTIKIRKINLNNYPIEWSKTAKYLGVSIDRKLNFCTHVDSMIKRAVSVRGMLYPILNKKSPIPMKTKINILKLYIIPRLTYAGAAWAPFISTSQWRRIEAVQTTTLRLITGYPKYVRNKVLLNSLSCKPIKNSIKNQSRAMFYKNEKSSHKHIRELGRSPSTQNSSIKVKPRPLAWSTLP